MSAHVNPREEAAEGPRGPWWLPVGIGATLVAVNLALDTLPNPWLALPVAAAGVAVIAGLAAGAGRRRRAHPRPDATDRLPRGLLGAQIGVVVAAFGLLAALGPGWLLAGMLVVLALVPLLEWALAARRRRAAGGAGRAGKGVSR